MKEQAGPGMEHHFKTKVDEFVDPILVEIIGKPLTYVEASPSTHSDHDREVYTGLVGNQQLDTRGPPMNWDLDQNIEYQHSEESTQYSSSEEETPMETTSCGSLMKRDHMECSEPIILEKLYVSAPDYTHQHFDPLISTETDAPQSIPQSVMGSGTMTAGSSKRPRGRPKKKLKDTGCEYAIVPWGLEEAQSTWVTAKMLGISSNNEEAVISNIEKSKRLQLMGNGST
ncbi:unnamed protein product [Amaranthus hypochondriacus]